MHRRSIVKWTSLAAISLFVTLLLLGIAHHDAAEASTIRTKAPDVGSLQAIDKSGKPAGECPLKHTSVKAEVSGFLSRVTVTQEFHNTFADKIEAVYTFPLPQAAAVDDMTMTIGERIVKGKVMRREEAQAAYSAAKKIGQVASLLDQERPNIFTQSVANIMPGQEIQITISYVETLKYEDGSYEWTFPMVVAPRYIPATEQENAPSAETEAETVPDSSRLNPPVAPEDMRAGHDISLEISLDAGVLIDGLRSETHETEVERTGSSRAVVRLKDRDVIPNKDFVLKYQVAGATIEDAVLAHRSDRGGFFTLILQPPQRIIAEDVMPKELVFVLDTSGSMQGFPLDKAKETMMLALDTLYPHDTFNVITFSGDTKVLFSDPVPATPENLNKAKKFLESSRSYGGTEMMKAINAALDPSDSQQHVRIACFMTDGEVGNDMEIISQVQKHPNARVFAMGFGSSPNRFLLDKMAEYGRGEVDYISESGDTSAVATRFNDRIRNPLLTDISIDWSGVPVTDVYPKRIPDLFGVKPVILSGRYSSGGKGVIRLKGKMAGQDFVREIPVELPDSEPGHDVLSTLWARRRIDDLMGQDMSGLQTGNMKEEPREEITKLGLAFKLMTQFTSFVAIDEAIFTPDGEPRRVEVTVNQSGSGIPSGITETVTVASSGSVLNTAEASFSTTITPQQIQDLPLQGRSVSSLCLLAPGSVSPGSGTLQNVRFGQRMTSSNLTIDGVSANFGIAAGGQDPLASAAGTSPAFTASGGVNGLSSMSGTYEMEIDSYYVRPELGRLPGAQIKVDTKAGSNYFHGSLFQFFGNSSFDANNWFANSRGLNQPPHHLNNFGGTFEGPIKRNHTFFFGSYEGLRLRQPMTAITNVPSMTARLAAPSGIQQFLNAFPVPTRNTELNGFSEFATTFANPASHDAFSIRVDSNVIDKLSLNGRYSFADSEAAERGAGGLSLNTTNRIRSRSQTLTGSVNYVPAASTVIEVRGNYSRLRVNGSYQLDGFGGAVIPSLFSSSFAFDLNARNAKLMTGEEASSVQRQFNFLGSATTLAGPHSFKFGADYRRLSPIIGMRPNEQGVLFNGVTQALTSVAGRITNFNRNTPQTPVFNNLSIYAQDQWKKNEKLEFTYGLRWEVNPAPSENDALAVNSVNDLSQLSLSPRGTSLWETTLGNFAPRVGFVYQLNGGNEADLVLRGGAGLHYDIGHERAGEAFTDSFPFLTGTSVFNSQFPLASTPSTSNSLPFSVFDPNLKLPFTLNWHVSLQKALGHAQTIELGYIGSTGRRLLTTQTLFDVNQAFPFIRLTTNEGESNYQALHAQFDRRFSRRLSLFASYTWSKSLDNTTLDSASSATMASAHLVNDRGPSDFDVRHLLSGFVNFEIPSIVSSGLGNKLLRNWMVSSIFSARSAQPVNAVYGFPTSFGFAYLRPNLVSGEPLYLLDPSVAGGRRINPAAFEVPAGLQQGNLGRNSLRGYPLSQIDLGLRRKFNFTESFGLQFQVDAFNLLNHPNFEDPIGTDLSLGSKFEPAGTVQPNLTFGQSASLNGTSVLSGGGFGSFYGTGGARSLRFAVKLMF